jgi:alkanesulfonate monooxygenase SsuD/methylene tetrahydromethanopterin reductase-like flavin-dependent oxidoreductase (luciferase family)
VSQTHAGAPRTDAPLFNANKMKLGVFGSNCSNGVVMSAAETAFRPTWEQNLAIGQLADRLGLELMLPVARWRGFGGDVDFNGDNMEVYTWAAALAARTEQIMVAATSHVPTVHPILAAKQGATIDHISHGRFALNIVCGWFRDEMEMFGAKQLEHDERYVRADEWLTVIKKLWSEQDFDHDGAYYRVHNGYALPKPVQQPFPVLINAGSSDAGQEFSAKHCDFNFIAADTLDNAERVVKSVKAKARTYDRDIGMMTFGLIVCRDTEREARQVYDRIVEKGDYPGLERLVAQLGIESGSFQTQIKQFAERFFAGWGGYPIVGSPEQVVDKLAELSRIGIDGFAAGWLDYHAELEYFGARVLPLMRQAGLRQ